MNIARQGPVTQASLGTLAVVLALGAATGVVAQSPLPPFEALAPAVDPVGRPIAALDANGDGAQDLLSTRGLALNDGGGRLVRNCCALPTNFVAASLLAAEPGDLDADGDLDAVVVYLDAFGQMRAEVWWNQSPFALFTVTTPLLPPAPAGIAYQINQTPVIVFGDLDGNGFVDIATNAFGLAIHLQSAPGAFTDGTTAIRAASGLSPSAVLIGGGDLDGDGLLELLCDTPAPSSTIPLGISAVVEYSPLANTYTTSTPFNAAAGVFRASVQADFNGDGRRDVLICRAGTTFGVVDELVAFSGASLASTPALRSAVALLGAVDLDADGRKDVLRHTDLGTVEGFDVVLGTPLNTPPVWEEGPYLFFASYFPFTPRYITLDADQDGDDDLVGARYAALPAIEQLVYGLYLRTSAGNYVSEEPDFNASLKGQWAADARYLGDFDSDGDLDLALPAEPGGASSLVLRRNDGKGRFADGAPGTTPMTGNSSFGFVADFDGDGDPEVFTPWSSGPGNLAAVHALDAAGNFVATPVAVGIPSEPAAWSVLDHDLDGDLDVLYVGSAPAPGGQGLNLARNTGGSFAPPVTLAPFTVHRAAVLTANADGIPDFVVVSQSFQAGVPAVLQRSINVVSGADGSVIAALGLIPAVGFEGALAAGDIDGDGDDDFMVEGTTYLKLGALFVPIVGVAPATSSSLGVKRRYLTDVDIDGDLDLIETSESEGFYFAGLGGGAFAAPIALDVHGANLRFADVDRDGDLDVLDQLGRLRTNITAGLARGRTPAIGRSGSLEARGPAGAPIELFASATAFAQTPFALPGWGNLWLIPSQAVYLGALFLDSSGRADISFAIPNVPALSGAVLYWQAALPTLSRLTNAVETKFYLP
jgi:hypothetical protein